MAKKALITGITGQDGSYLAELLLEKGYLVHGLARRTSSSSFTRILSLQNHPNFFLHEGDLTDFSSLKRLLEEISFEEIYNLAAMSHVQSSFSVPLSTADINGLGVLRFLELLRNSSANTKFYQASTSELFGKVKQVPQNENTAFHPRSPYATSKLFAYWSVVNYREAYHLFACNGILFNHESPRRGENFVTRKITLAAARIERGLQTELVLGNLEAKRDWGYAKDFVEGMWRILQQKMPEDFVLSTGKTHSVREFVELVFEKIGRNLVWEGKGLQEVGRDRNTQKILVRVSPEYFRPTEVDLLLGDPSKAKKKLGWEASTDLKNLASLMVEEDRKTVERICQESSC